MTRFHLLGVGKINKLTSGVPRGESGENKNRHSIEDFLIDSNVYLDEFEQVFKSISRYENFAENGIATVVDDFFSVIESEGYRKIERSIKHKLKYFDRADVERHGDEIESLRSRATLIYQRGIQRVSTTVYKASKELLNNFGDHFLRSENIKSLVNIVEHYSTLFNDRSLFDSPVDFFSRSLSVINLEVLIDCYSRLAEFIDVDQSLGRLETRYSRLAQKASDFSEKEYSTESLSKVNRFLAELNSIRSEQHILNKGLQEINLPPAKNQSTRFRDIIDNYKKAAESLKNLTAEQTDALNELKELGHDMEYRLNQIHGQLTSQHALPQIACLRKAFQGTISKDLGGRLELVHLYDKTPSGVAIGRLYGHGPKVFVSNGGQHIGEFCLARFDMVDGKRGLYEAMGAEEQYIPIASFISKKTPERFSGLAADDFFLYGHFPMDFCSRGNVPTLDEINKFYDPNNLPVAAFFLNSRDGFLITKNGISNLVSYNEFIQRRHKVMDKVRMILFNSSYLQEGVRNSIRHSGFEAIGMTPLTYIGRPSYSRR